MLNDLGRAMQRADELITRQMERRRALLHERVDALEQVSVAIMGSRTEGDLGASLRKASTVLESHELESLNAFDEFEYELSHLEEGLLDLAAEQSWEVIAEAKRHPEEAAAVADMAGPQEQETSQPEVDVTAIERISSQVEELLRFIDPDHGNLPLVSECRERLRHAKSLKSDLQRQWLEASAQARNQTERAVCDGFFEEIAKLETIIRDLRPLIRDAKKWSTKPGKPISGRSRQSELSAKKKDSAKKQTGKKPSGIKPAQVPAASPESSTISTGAGPRVTTAKKFHEMSAEVIAQYEEDYFEYVGMFHHLRKTSQNNAHAKEVRTLGGWLNARRSALSQWREAGGYHGETPKFIAEIFTGALPGESYARGVRARRRSVGQRSKKGGSRTYEKEMRSILRDLERAPSSGARRDRSGDVNRRVFLTAGRVNPRATKRRGDW